MYGSEGVYADTAMRGLGGLGVDHYSSSGCFWYNRSDDNVTNFLLAQVRVNQSDEKCGYMEGSTRIHALSVSSAWNSSPQDPQDPPLTSSDSLSKSHFLSKANLTT